MNQKLAKVILSLCAILVLQVLPVKADETWTPEPVSECSAMVLADVAAFENPFFMLPKGYELQNVTQYRTGVGMTPFDNAYCSKGGYCYPEMIRVAEVEEEIPAIKLSDNCWVDRDTGTFHKDGNGDEIGIFYVIPKDEKYQRVQDESDKRDWESYTDRTLYSLQTKDPEYCYQDVNEALDRIEEGIPDDRADRYIDTLYQCLDLPDGVKTASKTVSCNILSSSTCFDLMQTIADKTVNDGIAFKPGSELSNYGEQGTLEVSENKDGCAALNWTNADQTLELYSSGYETLENDGESASKECDVPADAEIYLANENAGLFVQLRATMRDPFGGTAIQLKANNCQVDFDTFKLTNCKTITFGLH